MSFFHHEHLLDAKVVELNHTPASVLSEPKPVFVGKTIVNETTQTQIPEEWSITIQGKDSKGQLRKKTIIVDSMTWNTLNVGDIYNGKQ